MSNDQLEYCLDDIEKGSSRLEVEKIDFTATEATTLSGGTQVSVTRDRTTTKSRLVPYLPLRAREIRLVNFGATGSDTPLVHVSLDDNPKFTALSYCWGRENCKHLFEINGCILVLTSSLYIIFESLRERGFDGVIWADAVCINQDDVAEKEAQIPLMGKIFGDAEQTIAWLGTPSEEWQLKADSFDIFFRQLVESEYKVPRNTYLDEDLAKKLGLPPLDDKVWHALVQAITSGWWSRLWIIQELVLAKELVLYFDPMKFDFEAFTSLVDILGDLNVLITFPALYDDSHKYSMLATVFNLKVLRDDFQNHDTTIYDIIDLSSTAQVSYKNDSIYGLYSLVDFADMIPLDLSIPANELFIRAAKAWRRLEPGSLMLLSLAVRQPKLPGMPSWVPDFSFRGFPEALDEYAYLCATGLAIELSESGVSMVNGEDELQLEGFVLDHVELVLSTPWPVLRGDDTDEVNAQAGLTTIAACERIIAAALPAVDLEARRMILCRTMCADMPAHFRDSRQHWQESDLADFDKIMLQYGKAARDEDWDFKDAGDLDDSIRYVIEDRAMISTRRGRIGLATERAQPGDAILVLFGAHVPYVARKKPENGHYELIAQAYIDGEGIMDGEACEKHKREGKPAEHFVFD